MRERCNEDKKIQFLPPYLMQTSNAYKLNK